MRKDKDYQAFFSEALLKGFLKPLPGLDILVKKNVTLGCENTDGEKPSEKVRQK